MNNDLSMTLLVVEDTDETRTLYKFYLQDEAYNVTYVNNGADALAYIQKEVPNSIILDLNLPDMDGMDILKYINEHNLHCAVIVATAQDSVDIVVEAMRYKAYDFILKPFDEQRLLVTLRNALQHQRLARTVDFYKQKFERTEFYGFIGASPAMQAVYQIIENAASSKATVFISGESGTGKELCAEAIHQHSPRKDKPFIVINCAAIPKDLMETEIFGHVKGAFTGALKERDGAAHQANGGSLFLDEICELSLDLQTKLLRFIQTSRIQKLGSNKEEKVDVRFICATNRDPLLEVEKGRFREDLYYRLHVIPIVLPPLREREGDILLLAKYFLSKYTQEEQKSFIGFSAETESILLNSIWKGNVRQLQNVIRNIVVLNEGKQVTPAMLPVPISPSLNQLSKLKTHNLESYTVADDSTPSKNQQSENMIRPLKEVEKEVIMQAIELCNGNVSKAAILLGVNPSTIYRKRQSWSVSSES
jgi:DNA-binding NtrC family response regulator